MRIAMFVDTYPPKIDGMTISVELFTNELRRRGHEVVVVAPRHPRHEYGPLHPDTLLIPAVASDWIYPDTSLGKFWKSMGRGVVAERFARWRPDIIHSHTEFTLGLWSASYWRTRLAPLGTRRVHTFHTLWTEYLFYLPIPELISQPLLRYLAPRTAKKRFDAIIAPSDKMRDALIADWGIPPDRCDINVVPTGIDLDRFRSGNNARFRQRWGIAAEDDVVLYLGRIGTEKNVELVIDTFAELQRRSHEHARYVIAGGGPEDYLVELRERAAAAKVDIVWTGFVRGDDLLDAYAAADLMLFPSTTETQGLVVTESLAAGVPLVSVEAMGPASTMRGERGCLFAADDPVAFADAAQRLLKDEVLYRRKCREAEEIARGCSIEHRTDELLAVYEKTLRSTAGPREDAPLASVGPIAVVVAALAALAAPACAPDAPRPETPALAPLPPLANAPTTRSRTLVPAHEEMPGDPANPALPENLDGYLEIGLGEVREGPADGVVVRALGTLAGVPLDAAALPPPGPNARRLARFVHLADLQLMDDESPTRAGAFDTTAVTAALRPQDSLLCRMLNAAVRTINALHAEAPIDFVLLGGDNADSAQENEVGWVLDILGGSDLVHCDSGDDNDLYVDAEDGKDPFASAGLDMPWRWVSGNHDVLVQGNFAVDEAQSAAALGGEAPMGTRIYQGEGFGSVVDGDVAIPDERRRLLDGPALLDLVGGDRDGHGLGADATLPPGATRPTGKAFAAFDVEATPLTVVVLDTAHGRGGASGVLQQSHVDAFVRPALDDALARGRVVLLASHHAADSLTSDGGIFGASEPDALTPDTWRELLAAYPNVLFSLVAHSHRNRVRVQQTPGHAFFEVMTSALADWPHQLRLIELYDDDNGTLRLEASPVDFATDDDPPAALGRALGLIDRLTGWSSDGTGAAEDRAVTLVIAKP
ncbi:MAG: glycosyltransferase [Deltaproteobacteria bacterium]|nr:glycosyltransferase [Deltaproteobacteria bacterium]